MKVRVNENIPSNRSLYKYRGQIIYVSKSPEVRRLHRHIKSGELISPLHFTIIEETMNNKLIEAYQTLQDDWVAQNNIKVGSRVRVIRTATSHEMGWSNSWSWGMELGEYTVGDISILGKGIALRCLDKVIGSYSYPFFVLEPMKPRKATVELNEEYCAHITEGSTDIIVGCQTIPIAKVEELLGEYGKINP